MTTEKKDEQWPPLDVKPLPTKLPTTATPGKFNQLAEALKRATKTK